MSAFNDFSYQSVISISVIVLILIAMQYYICRLLKDHLIMQAQDDISADIFFNGELQRLENMYQDLETPGCLSNKMRNKTIDLICSLRDLLDIIKTMEVEAQNESRECNERELMILNQKLFGIWNDLSVLQIPAIRKETFPCSEDQLNDTDINDVSSSKVFMVGNHNSFPFEHILAVKNTLKERQQEFKIDDIDSLSYVFVFQLSYVLKLKIWNLK